MSSSDVVKHIETEELDDDLLSKVHQKQDMELVVIKSHDSSADVLTDVKQETGVSDFEGSDSNTKSSIVLLEEQLDVDLSPDKEIKIQETSHVHSDLSIDNKPTPGGPLENDLDVIKIASEESEDLMGNQDTQTEKNVIELQQMTPGGPTPGEKLTSDDEDSKSELSAFSRPSDLDSEYEHDPFSSEDYHTKGDCAIMNTTRRRCCCIILNLLVWAAFFSCFIFYPHPVEVCLRLSFEDWDIADKLSGDKGRYELKISNPNYLDVDIKGLEINAYYGGVAEANGFININRTDYSITGHSSYNLTNQTFKFTQDCTAVISQTTLNSCSKEYRKFVDFQLEYAYTGCVFKNLCPNRIVFESTYESTCPEDSWVCTKLKVFRWPHESWSIHI